MLADKTTNEIRRKLVDMGATKPSLAAVRLIAHKIGGFYDPKSRSHTQLWQLTVDDSKIQRAIEACQGLRGRDSDRKFAEVLRS